MFIQWSYRCNKTGGLGGKLMSFQLFLRWYTSVILCKGNKTIWFGENPQLGCSQLQVLGGSPWIFVWDAAWGKVFTLDQLQNRGLTVVSRCPICKAVGEHIDLPLIHFMWAFQLWGFALAIFGLVWVPNFPWGKWVLKLWPDQVCRHRQIRRSCFRQSLSQSSGFHGQSVIIHFLKIGRAATNRRKGNYGVY